MASVVQQASHGALMDTVYRHQKHIYDATRKYYLFGRDGLIAGLDAAPGKTVLEVGCGTGRNLACIGRQWPGAHLYGLDISEEMLSVARQRLDSSCVLASGDATDFDANTLFGRATFDRIVISYALSMIPQWQQTLDHAASLLAPGGSLHIVDFGDFEGLPRPLRRLMHGWLTQFHVAPRADLAAVAARIAAERQLSLRTLRGRWGYFRRVTLRR
ncbi:class I SAM-dependent methyltransferase [Novosphingobium taihuense]|uniref:S-adenosylmethionine-diacylgycerolhomoserine-N-methyltransferase n=1 Tax=Novosphingobium taihuense TaxID=260085 RepID=A0A7W7AAY1_9SPHN|nr:class I SAM-dependent methyltransferase [Novosphingobium taihuense]MBB4613673.1 S-adenosylmethionine-diacylgycerolhomoserine-N-methyltransferase [Novosphingobium taihuense]TWH83183.1 S-adenosylmethionine-diacylgycerolhomoserine-N-methyltransferase [Novosphingobium taihuense]